MEESKTEFYCASDIILERVGKKFIKVSPYDWVNDQDYFDDRTYGEELSDCLFDLDYLENIRSLLLQRTERLRGTDFEIETKEKRLHYSIVFSGISIKDVVAKMISFYRELDKRSYKYSDKLRKHYTIKDGKVSNK